MHVTDEGDRLPVAGLRVTSMTVGFRAVVAVEGDIDMATLASLAQVLSDHVESPARELWVDLSRVRFMDSHGLHALHQTHEELARDRRRLIVICPHGPVRRLLRLSGLDDELLTVVPDRTAAQLSA